MTDIIDKVNFDHYADTYEDIVNSQLSFFSKGHGYFSEYKVEIAANSYKGTPRKILDFGCGIGLSIPYLTKYFPSSKIYATDLSERSLDHVRDNYQNILALSDQEVRENSFDLIFVSGVFHHISPELRPSVIERLATLLVQGGSVIIFEHNPLNPVTRKMVATCPFDEDAVLINLREMQHLITSSARLTILKTGYCLYFPQSLQLFRPLEKLLRWLPLGGQYFVIGHK